MTEAWKDVVGYEGVYQVSNYGRVKRLTYRTKRSDGSSRLLKEKILKGKDIKRKHKRVSLWKDGKSNDYFIHRLVASAFIPKVPNKNNINHINGIPSDNRVENLEWCTTAENNLHAHRNNLNKSSKRIKLISTTNGEEKYFLNQRLASAYLGQRHNYISEYFNKGIKIFDKSGNPYIAERVEFDDVYKQIQTQ